MSDETVKNRFPRILYEKERILGAGLRARGKEGWLRELSALEVLLTRTGPLVQRIPNPSSCLHTSYFDDPKLHRLHDPNIHLVNILELFMTKEEGSENITDTDVITKRS